MVSLAANPVLHASVKHVELDLHFVRDKVKNGVLQVNYVPGKEQVADVLTKPLTIGNFSYFRARLSVVSLADFSAGVRRLSVDISS